MTPEALMAAHLAGDAAAFPALYRALAPSVAALLRTLTRDRAAADDCAQVAWAKLHRHAATWDGRAVEPWLRTIARNTALDALRSRRRSRVVLTATGDVPEPVALPVVDAWDRLSDDEQARLRAALDALPAMQREALRLLKVEGLSLRETAARLGTTVGAVKLRAHRAYVSVRAAMAADVAVAA